MFIFIARWGLWLPDFETDVFGEFPMAGLERSFFESDSLMLPALEEKLLILVSINLSASLPSFGVTPALPNKVRFFRRFLIVAEQFFLITIPPPHLNHFYYFSYLTILSQGEIQVLSAEFPHIRG